MDQRFLQQAIALAVENVRRNGGPFGALVVRDGVVIATGFNQVTRSNDPTAHAEVVAIREACRVLARLQLAGLRRLLFLRALPDVPRRALLGSSRPHLFRRHAGPGRRRRLRRFVHLPRDCARPSANAGSRWSTSPTHRLPCPSTSGPRKPTASSIRTSARPPTARKSKAPADRSTAGIHPAARDGGSCG